MPLPRSPNRFEGEQNERSRQERRPYGRSDEARDRDRGYDQRGGSSDRAAPRSKYDDERRMDRGRDRSHSRRQDDDGRDRSRYEDRERSRDREPERRRDRERDDRGGERDGKERERDHRSRRTSPPPLPRRSASPASRPRSTRPTSRSASPPVDKSKPNFAPSGLLAAATNTVRAVDGTSTVLKYNEPPEARKPMLGWRLYVFKGSEQVELLHIHRQSAYLIGRDRLVADIAVDHPSCSKQHAVIQYRQIYEKDELGNPKAVVKPFIIDLESTNGTHVNDEATPVSRFYELKMGDVIKFGQSTREYVLLHEEAGAKDD